MARYRVWLFGYGNDAGPFEIFADTVEAEAGVVGFYNVCERGNDLCETECVAMFSNQIFRKAELIEG